MITISLCMIVRNEADTLVRCLLSVANLVEEIVIVDTGSTDRTKDVAARFTDQVYDFAWVDDFSAARNFSYAQATMEYILWLDADDVLLPEDAAKLMDLKQSMPPDIDAVMMRYNTGFDSRGSAVFSCFRERLSRRSCYFQWIEPVHEYLEVGWKRLTVDICVTHAKPQERQSGRNIRIYENLLSKGRALSPRGLYYYARELKDGGRYADAIKWFSLFLDSEQGWMEDNIAACGELAKCFLAEEKPKEALLSMLRSFCYDTPRPEICCQIGAYWISQYRYAQAVFWFELILEQKEAGSNWGFRDEDCRGYTPCLQLAVCYDNLGEYEKAAAFNEKAAAFKPDSPAVTYNREYFKSRFDMEG